MILAQKVNTLNTVSIVPFAELVDLAEEKGTLLILTTNLTVDELRVKYGERVVNRLKAITNIIYFKGSSLRK